jgi:hypothetical protein
MGPPRKAGLDISTVCVPYTLGGSDLAAALQHQGINLNLSPEHYCQTDVSRNKDVWDLYPVEGGYGVDADDALWQVSRKASQECRR